MLRSDPMMGIVHCCLFLGNRFALELGLLLAGSARLKTVRAWAQEVLGSWGLLAQKQKDPLARGQGWCWHCRHPLSLPW